MRFVLIPLLGGLLTVTAGAACAQTPKTASPPASATAPAAAASRAVPTRNPAITAAENAKEPGAQRPDERVIPQISVPLKSRRSTILAEVAASASARGASGVVNDVAARCLASGSSKAACEREAAASRPAAPRR
jgi:hypothetical protein